MDAIDLSNGTIQSFPPLKQARSYPSSVVVTKENKEILYVLGGYHRTILSSVEKFVIIILLIKNVLKFSTQSSYLTADGIL